MVIFWVSQESCCQALFAAKEPKLQAKDAEFSARFVKQIKLSDHTVI